MIKFLQKANFGFFRAKRQFLQEKNVNKSIYSTVTRFSSQGYRDDGARKQITRFSDAFEHQYSIFDKTSEYMKLEEHQREILGFRLGFTINSSTYKKWQYLVDGKQKDSTLDEKSFGHCLEYLLLLGVNDKVLWEKVIKQTEVRFTDMTRREQINCCYYPTKAALYNENPKIVFSDTLIKKSFELTKEKSRYKRYELADQIKTAFSFHNWGIDVNILLDYIISDHKSNPNELDTKIHGISNGILADAAWLFCQYEKDPAFTEKFLYGFLEGGVMETDAMQQDYELSYSKVQEFGESDARLWESLALISEVLRKEQVLQMEEVIYIESAIHEKSENHIIDIKSASTILSNLGIYMRKRGSKIIFEMLQDQILYDIENIVDLFSAEVCLKILDGLSQLIEIQHVGQSDIAYFLTCLIKLLKHIKFWSSFEKDDVTEILEEQESLHKVNVIDKVTLDEIKQHCNDNSFN